MIREKLFKISIITVVFNDKALIEKTILSCLSQKYPNIEYIIIDGDSKDGTLAIIDKYKSRLSYFVSEQDKGIYDAMNKGIAVATGEWINFMNAGDCFYNDNVLNTIFSTDLSADIIYGKNQCIYPYFDRINEPLPLERLKYGMIFSHQSMLVKTALMKAQNFDLSFKLSADYHFIYNAFKKGLKLKSVDTIISTVLAGGVSESNLIHTHLERKRIALQHERGISNLLLTCHYNIFSVRILAIKWIKFILPQSFIQKITVLKYQ